MSENLPAQMSDLDTGLEDLTPSEIAVPRISINHKGGTFKDNLTGQEFSTIQGILLGLVKQRVMWPDEITDDGKPMCKSSDFQNGYPLMEGSRDAVFPWAEAGFGPEDTPVDGEGRTIIKCETCPFAQWTQGKGKNIPPRCSERHTFPVIYSLADPFFGDLSNLTEAGIVSFQRSGITPSRKFLSGFARAKRPLYSALSKVTLERQKRGNVEYSTPVFQKIGDVPQEDWEQLAIEYRQLRDHLRRVPKGAEDRDPATQHTSAGNKSATHVEQVVDAEIVSSPVVKAAPVSSPAPTATAAVAATVEDDDDLPF